MRRTALVMVQHRSLTVRAASSREAAEDLVRVDREQRRLVSQSREVSLAALDAADRLGPSSADEAVTSSVPYLEAPASPAEPRPPETADDPHP
jgi:hypothetical protein